MLANARRQRFQRDEGSLESPPFNWDVLVGQSKTTGMGPVTIRGLWDTPGDPNMGKPERRDKDTKGQALATLKDLQEHDRGMAMERPYKGPILSAKAPGESVPSVNRTWPKGTGSRRIKIDGIDE